MLQIVNIIKEKCPNCHKGDVFQTSGNIFKFKMPRMNDTCPNCGYKFEREIGFFFGAMFVSYALAAGEMIAVLVLLWALLGLSPLYVFFTVVVVAFLASTLNFRLSRMIWMYIFYRKE